MWTRGQWVNVAEMTEILGKYGKIIFIEDVAIENPMKHPVNGD